LRETSVELTQSYEAASLDRMLSMKSFS